MEKQRYGRLMHEVGDIDRIAPPQPSSPLPEVRAAGPRVRIGEFGEAGSLDLSAEDGLRLALRLLDATVGACRGRNAGIYKVSGKTSFAARDGARAVRKQIDPVFQMNDRLLVAREHMALCSKTGGMYTLQDMPHDIQQEIVRCLMVGDMAIRASRTDQPVLVRVTSEDALEWEWVQDLDPDDLPIETYLLMD